MSAGVLTLLLKALDLALLGIQFTPAIRLLFVDITTSVKLMVAKERDPTAEEWELLDALRDTIHKAIQEAHPND